MKLSKNSVPNKAVNSLVWDTFAKDGSLIQDSVFATL